MSEFTHVTPALLRESLGRDLIDVVDCARDIASELGVRPYVVRIVRTRWSGGARGAGVEEVMSALDLLPTPKVSDLSGLAEVLQPVGLDEVGGVQVEEISGRFSEEELRFLSADGAAPEPQESVWWEIEFIRHDGKPGQRRRFALSGAPEYLPTRVQWRVRLTKAHEDRGRDGVPR